MMTVNQKYIVLDDCLIKNGGTYLTLDSILESRKEIHAIDADRKDQGFLTSENRFVDRKEAWKIAKKEGQIYFGYEASNNGENSELISENLY